MDDYSKLLDSAYASLPEKKGSGERFEVPKVDVLIEGNKTFVKNFSDICAKLRREPRDVAKYLFKELATPGAIESTRLVLQRKLSMVQINDKLNAYVESNVYCKACKRPDTHVESPDRTVRILVCEACGAKSPLRA